MNSQKKLYDELLKEHPELKDSHVDISEVISLMQELNPDIVADQDYKDALKQRLETIANYSPQKSNSIFWFLKYFIPVFSFWFAVFWFLYFSDEFQSEQKNMDTQIQFKTMQIKSVPENMQDENVILWDEQPANSSFSSRMSLKSIWEENDMNWDNKIQEDTTVSQDLSDEVQPMMFSMDVMIEDESNNNEQMQVEVKKAEVFETKSLKIEDTFADMCWEYNGLLVVLEDNSRTCILEDKNCDEVDYIDTECFYVITTKE